MGKRFRKSVKICKGVKVNFTKSGASLSLVGRGHSFNIGSKGARTTVGIPGTGLSYSTKLGAKSSSHKSGGSGNTSSRQSSVSSRTASQGNLPSEVQIEMDVNGKVIIKNQYGYEITDPDILRKIKATTSFKYQKEQLDRQRKKNIDQIVKESAEENKKFINIYKLTPDVDPLQNYEERLSGLQPNSYVMEIFKKAKPTESSIMSVLEKEANETIKGFMAGRHKKQYVANNLSKRFSDAMAEWEKERKEFIEDQSEKKRIADQEYQEEYENQKQFLSELIAGSDSSVSEVFDEWISSCELPVEINIDYDWNLEKHCMMLDVDLPEIEDLSTTIMIKTDSGKLKEKKKTQTELREEYAKVVFGLAMFISANAFNVSPAIHNILFSAYTQRRDKEGNLNDDYIYSIKFNREKFEKGKLSSKEPVKFCMSFENRCNMTTTSLFKSIKPYDDFE